MSLRRAVTSHPILLLLAAIGTTVAPPAQAQLLRTAKLAINTRTLTPDSSYRLRDLFVIRGTDSLVAGGSTLLQRGTEYHLDERFGAVRFDSAGIAILKSLSTAGICSVTASYRYLPFRFQDEYALRRLVTVPDSTMGKRTAAVRTTSSLDLKDVFGPDLRKSGSLFRGFNVGTNRDLTLNSGLRLQLAGRLAADVDVVASLTDENTPIQPEGTTQSLQEFDKVFVEIRAASARATLGDFVLESQGTEFANLFRKVQGARGDLAYKLVETNGELMVSAAVPRGKYTTNQFNGLDAVQGPYRLFGKNNEAAIIVIAGSERVYVDGIQMTRGQTNDYTIDYSLAEITFSQRRLVNAASRITVDFEYTDRQYSRTLLGGSARTNFFNNKGSARITFLREADDPDDPVDFSISDSTRGILEEAGDDPFNAVISGATRVDSNGLYIQIDTLIQGNPVSFYRYAPGPTAPYIVAFTYVGATRGDYVRLGVGVFEYRGSGGGDYLPVRFLPLPAKNELFDAALSGTLFDDLTVSGEYARSNYDANRFSGIDDEDNGANAFTVAARYAPRDLRLGDLRLGSLDLKLKERHLDATFTPLDRFDQIEFNRYWGVDSTVSADERLREGSLRWISTFGLSTGASYGTYRRGDLVDNRRTGLDLGLLGTGLPTASYIFELINTMEKAIDSDGRWLRQRALASQRLGDFEPFLRYEGEDKRLSSISTGNPKAGSLAYDLAGGGVRYTGPDRLTLYADWEYRDDRAFLQDAVYPQAVSFTQTYRAAISATNHFLTTLDVTLRDKDFRDKFEQAGNADNTTVLVRSQTRYAPFNRGADADMLYEVSTARSAKLERVFVQVQAGTGNYRYKGDINGNGIADNDEFELVRFDGDFVALTLPAGELEPVVDVKASLRLRLRPELFTDPSTDFLITALRAVTTETYLRADERSTTSNPGDVYLLKPSALQQDSTTIAGTTLFSQDLNIFETRPEFSARLRYLQRKSLNNFTSGSERSYLRERSIRLRWRLVPEIANELDLINRTEGVAAPSSPDRQRDIVANTISFDISYRPEQAVEFGLRLDGGRSTDSPPGLEEAAADLNAQTARLTYALANSGQARAEFAREEIQVDGSRTDLPYELTGGRLPGITWLWRGSLDYRVTDFLQATLQYDGRSEGGNPPVHTGRAEVRAFF
jgi:hypothetical protein